MKRLKRLQAHSLSWQLLKAVLSIYFLITLLVTLVQMGVEFMHTRNMIKHELVLAERTFYPALATALWEINHEQLEALQQGIIDLPLISTMRILEASGRESIKSSDEQSFGTNIQHRFRVHYRFAGEEVFLAEVVFETADIVVIDRLKVGFQMIVVSALIKSMVLALLFLLIFRRRLGVPLAQLTEAVSSLDLDTLNQKRIDFGQSFNNELTSLQKAFNRMLYRLDRERRDSVAKLEEVNRSLEQQVQERTAELLGANRQLEQLVRTDPLTGVANRRQFIEQAMLEIERSHRSGRALSLLMIDLDHFKAVNDRYGHGVGDDVLRHFCLALEGPLRTNDLLARIGGEEFAVLLPETALEDAQTVATRILEAIRHQPLQTAQTLIHFTVSIGVASLRQDENNYEPLLARADSALYAAKSAGRDRFVISGP